MKALFYNQKGQLVWECTKDAKYEINNGTKAINKGAFRGYLFTLDNKLINTVEYLQNQSF